MAYLDDTFSLLNREEVKSFNEDLLINLIGTVLGDLESFRKLMCSLKCSPAFIREQLFLMKLEKFLSGVFLNEDDRNLLQKRLSENGMADENAVRIIECIDKIDSQRKVQYLINATRSLMNDAIDRISYFRICHVIKNTLEEDLLFLTQHIDAKCVLYNDSVQGLLNIGLMYQSVIDVKNEQKYSFTPFAGVLYQFAINYYDSKELAYKFEPPKPEMPNIPEILPVTHDEINNIWNGSTDGKSKNFKENC